MDPTERNPGAGAALGALSAAKNKKLTAGIGAALIVIGLAGLIIVGSQAIDTITGGGFESPQQGSSIQLTQYVFLFTMLAGLIVMIYSIIGIQRDHDMEPSRDQFRNRFCYDFNRIWLDTCNRQDDITFVIHGKKVAIRIRKAYADVTHLPVHLLIRLSHTDHQMSLDKHFFLLLLIGKGESRLVA
jgi:hypothetical protein